MKILKSLFLLIISLSILGLMSCTPELKIKIKNDNSVDVSFKTGFSQEVSKILRSMSNIKDDEPILSANDMTTFLTESGATNVKAILPNQNEIEASGSVNSLKNSMLYSTELLKSDSNNKKKNLTLKIGPNGIKKFYELLDENTKSYLDVMLIPALTDTTATTESYKMLLASLYGPTFATEMIEGNLKITVETPNGKKTTMTENLGEILTLTNDKTWVFEW